MESVEYTELMPGNIITLSNLLSADECKRLIDIAEKSGFQPATLNIGAEQNKVVSDVRNHHRYVVEDKSTADDLWKKIVDHLGSALSTDEDGNPAYNVSSQIRYYRYDEGQRFVRHYDGYEYGSVVYPTKEGPKPKLTLLIYLNDDFEGGKTTFFNGKGNELLSVAPVTGAALIYRQTLLHEGSVVDSGRKYVLRADVMFGKPVVEPPQQTQSYCSVM